MSRDPVIPGYYWVQLATDWAVLDEPDRDWYVAEWDGKNWFVCGDDSVAYISVVGPKIEPPEPPR